MPSSQNGNKNIVAKIDILIPPVFEVDNSRDKNSDEYRIFPCYQKVLL